MVVRLAMALTLLAPQLVHSQVPRIADVEAGLKSPDATKRLEAIQNLGRVHPSTRATNALTAALMISDGDVQIEALRVLEKRQNELRNWDSSIQGMRMRAGLKPDLKWSNRLRDALVSCIQTCPGSREAAVLRTIARISADDDVFEVPYPRCGTGSMESVSYQASHALTQAYHIDPNRVLALLDDANFRVVQGAAEAIGGAAGMREKLTHTELGRIEELLNSPMAERRAIGIRAISMLSESVRWLAPRLEDTDTRVRRVAFGMIALGSGGREFLKSAGKKATAGQRAAQVFVSALYGTDESMARVALRDPSPAVRLEALYCVVNRETVVDRSDLEAPLNSDDPTISSLALMALERTEPIRETKLMGMLMTESGEVQDTVAEILGRKGGATLPVLESLLRYQEENVERQVSKEPLRRALWSNPLAHTFIKSLIRSPKETTRCFAFGLVPTLSEQRAAALAPLAKADSSPAVRALYPSLLGDINSPEPLKELVSMLGDPAHEVRLASALRLFGSDSKEAMKALAALADSQDDQLAEIGAVAVHLTAPRGE